MEKIYLSKKARKAIEQAMPAGIRKAYKAGAEINMEIVREKTLFKYGRTMKLCIAKNGRYISSDKEDETNAENIAENITEYFVYGNRGTLATNKTKAYVNGHLERITQKWVVGGNYAISF